MRSRDSWPHALNVPRSSFSSNNCLHLIGHVNKQNCSYWSSTNPQSKRKKPLPPPKLILRMYFFWRWQGPRVNSECRASCKDAEQLLCKILLIKAHGFSRMEQHSTLLACLWNEYVKFSSKNWFPEEVVDSMDFSCGVYLKPRVYSSNTGFLVQLKENICLV